MSALDHATFLMISTSPALARCSSSTYPIDVKVKNRMLAQAGKLDARFDGWGLSLV